MANIKGVPANILPSVVAEVVTDSRGVSVPGGVRTAVLIGEGSRSERIVTSALGSARDGFNTTYTSNTGSDSRHFKLDYSPIISNRTTVFKNGIPLVGVEQEFDSSSGSFSSKFDYRLDITTGHIELQTAALVDQGGAYYSANSLNVGTGVINGLSLIDNNAPTEVWTIRCSSTRRDGYGVPIDGYAKFIAQGSISGILLDGYGNQITWQSNGVSVSNNILQFSISEGGVTFREGDKFVIRVKGGALSKGDSLSATYIAEADLNDPEFFTDIDVLVKKHGSPSLTNRLSLGAQLAFANGPPGVYACQAAPSVPRRISYLVEDSASGGATVDDLSFPLPLNIIPDVDSNIHFFVTDPTTQTETQLLFNKVDFYNDTFSTSPATFITGGDHTYSYTVVLEDSITKHASDAVITSIGPTSATISSTLIDFDSNDIGLTIKLLEPSGNAGNYTIAAVIDGVATISNGSDSFSNETEVEFEVIDNSSQSAQILLTNDAALGAGQKLRVTVVDTKDASFFDVNWQAALTSLEKIECDIVVPLPSQTISSIFTAAKIHCDTMSLPGNKKERMLFIGAIKGLTSDQVIGTDSAAVEDIGILEGIQGDDISEILAGNVEDLTDYSVPNAYGNTFNVVYFYPDEIVVQAGSDRISVDGFFLAAAAAGYLSGVANVAIPLTNKVLAGFSILRNKLFRPITLQNLAAAGITILQPAIGGGTVLWGKTTTQSGFAEEEEISIVFIRNRIAKSMRTSFQAFVGIAETPTLQGTLMARANTIMQSFISQGLITVYADVKVARDSVESRQWNVSAKVQPVYSVNWLYLRIGVGLL